MAIVGEPVHHTIFRHPEHCVNQAAVRTLANGELVCVFNEERFPYHHDSGQTLLVRSRDGGVTWTEPTVVLPWSETLGNWDCGICELADGTLLVNLSITGFFKRGIKPEQPSWSMHPMTREWGDWTWAWKTQGWLGTAVLKSADGGATWSSPIPVNVRPLKHGGVRSGCWQLPSGPILMGLYGRIRGYGEEGEGETTRSALVRSDDGGDNWEYYSTLAYDPASIIDYEEPALLRLPDGRLVCFMRTHVQPSDDAKNMVMTVSDDDGFSWQPPKWTNIWGYPADLVTLQDGRHLMVYGYRRPPYGVRGSRLRGRGSPGTSRTSSSSATSRARPGPGRRPRGACPRAAASTGATPASTSTSGVSLSRVLPSSDPSSNRTETDLLLHEQGARDLRLRSQGGGARAMSTGGPARRRGGCAHRVRRPPASGTRGAV